MKQALFFLALLCLIAGANAQPVFHSANLNPVAGDKIIQANAKVAGIKIPASGTSITWNYATLKDSTSVLDTITYSSKTGTPFGSLFPAANIASTTTASKGFYSYFKTSTASLLFDGYAAKGDTLIYAPPYRLTTYPLTYGTNFTDTSTLTVKQTGQSITEGFRDSVTAVAYGTLKLPGSRIFKKVLMLKATSIIGYTILGHHYSTTAHNYQFFVSGYHNPLLEISTNAANQVVAAVYSKDATPALSKSQPDVLAENKVVPVAKAAFTIYPNPAVSTFTISANQNNKTVSGIVITDMSGKNIFVERKNISSGETVSCAAFRAGIYFVRIQMNDGTEEVQKLVVVK